MKCVFCGSPIIDQHVEQLTDEQLLKELDKPLENPIDTRTEINVAAFKHEDYYVLMFVPLMEDRAYRIYHFSLPNGSTPREQFLHASKTQARIVMFEGDSLLILGLRPGFPTLRIQCKNGAIVSEQLNVERLNIIFGDVNGMSQFAD